MTQIQTFLAVFLTLNLAGCKPQQTVAPSATSGDSKPGIDTNKNDRSQNLSSQLQALWPNPTRTEFPASLGLTLARHYWPSSFDQSQADALSPSGSLTPKIEGMLIAKSPTFADEFFADDFKGTQDENEKTALRAYYTVASSDALASGHNLPHLVGDRLLQAKPTRGDVMMFRLLDDAYSTIERPKSMSSEAYKGWHTMATAPNAVYRLLALRRFGSVEPDSERVILFYDQFSKDSDEVIVGELVRLVSGTAGTKRLAILRSILDRPTMEFAPSFRAKVEGIAQDLERLLRRQGAIK